MYKHIIYTILTAMIICLLLSSCGEEKYPGQNTVTYEVNSPDKPILINVLENDKKFLSCVVTIDLTEKNDAGLLSEKNHWIRDIIIEKCRSKTLKELQEARIMESLGQELAQEISQQFSINSIFRISFPTFYLN